jgi:uncharacterized membrane protein
MAKMSQKILQTVRENKEKKAAAKLARQAAAAALQAPIVQAEDVDFTDVEKALERKN